MNKKLIRKMLTASGGPLQLTPEELKYLKWSKMTPELKKEYRNNRINAELQRGPNLKHFWEAFQTYIGNRDPKNPNLNVGVINVAGTPMSSLSAVSTASRAMGGPKNIFSLNKLWRMVNKRIGRSLDSEEFSDLISNSSINNIRNAAIESDNNFPIIRITELEANDFINSLRPGLKQGGKMNILEFLKNGSGIHIKEKNKGKFTSYCGGKVTDECILKGKNSSNPAIRKRATFADNARHFKHKDGGILYIFLEGGKTSWWNKAINFVNNSGLGEAALNALSTYTLNKLIGASSDVAKALVDKDKASKILQANLTAELEARNIQLNNINPENPNAMGGDIVKNFIKNKLLSLKMALINLESNLEKAEIDWQTLLLKNLNTTNMWAGIGSTLMQGLGHVGLYLGNKLLTNVNSTQ